MTDPSFIFVCICLGLALLCSLVELIHSSSTTNGNPPIEEKGWQ